ncbi:MAG: heavy metal-binding domain-containing protein [Bdellovibrionales bacterium]|nr:heavy metal-binding domain-containing protein [Oligoflexia bacterium]
MPGHKKVTGLSGNEIYCLSKIGMRPGQLCVGNSVVAIGVAKGIGASLSTLGGGEVREVTDLVHEGRMKSFNRMAAEAKHYGGAGITGVSFSLINHGGNIEFISTGSTVHGDHRSSEMQFSTSGNAQQFYCQKDAGFDPLHFVFGNVAYSIGLGGSLGGAFKQLSRGEVSQYTEIFDRTRHLALERISSHAKQHGANAVIGIQTTIAPLLGAQEMMMVGTASHHPALGDLPVPVTCDMTNEELWNMVNLGYMPIKLVMGVSVYSLGLRGGILSALQSLGGGEVSGLTEILYEAREKALARIERDAEACGADEVVGVKIRVYDLGAGLVEFMAIGTAVKKMAGVSTKSENLPPQAIIQDRETFVDVTEGGALSLDSTNAQSARKLQRGPASFIGFIIFIAYLFLTFKRGH